MDKVLFFDLETDTLRSDWPEEPTFELATERMHMTVGCAQWGPLHFPDKPHKNKPKTRTYWRRTETDHDLEELGRDFDAATMIVMYNGLRFDMTVLHKYYDDDRWKSWIAKFFDPFSEIYSTHKWMVSLNALAKCNGIKQKTMSGTEAPRLWKTKQLNILEEYCAHDVTILASIVYRGEQITIPIMNYGRIEGYQDFSMAQCARALLTPGKKRQREEEEECVLVIKRTRPFVGRKIASYGTRK